MRRNSSFPSAQLHQMSGESRWENSWQRFSMARSSLRFLWMATPLLIPSEHPLPFLTPTRHLVSGAGTCNEKSQRPRQNPARIQGCLAPGLGITTSSVRIQRNGDTKDNSNHKQSSTLPSGLPMGGSQKELESQCAPGKIQMSQRRFSTIQL